MFSVKFPVKRNKKQEWVSKDYPVYQYAAKIDLKEDTYPADVHPDPVHGKPGSKMADHSEGLLVFPEQMIKTESNSDDPRALEDYLPKGFGNLFVLNAYAGIKNENTRHQLINSPYSLAPIGKEIGKAAAELATKTGVPKKIDYLASTGDEAKFAVLNLLKAFVLMIAQK